MSAGLRCGHRPHRVGRADWTARRYQASTEDGLAGGPEIWGGFVGKPGLLKSPAMMEALKPLHHLEAEAAKAHARALIDHQAALAEFKLQKSVKESVLKDQLKKHVAEKVVSLGSVSSLKDMIKDAQKEDPLGLGAGPEEPRPVRYRTNTKPLSD